VHVLRAPGVRVVASPEAIDGATWQDAGPGPEVFEPLILRFAPDEAFAIGATGVRIDDPDAIAESRQRSPRTCTGLRIAIDGDD